MAMASPCMSSRKLHKPLLKQSRSVGDNVQIENNLSRSKRYLESVVKKNYTHIKYNSLNHIFLYEKIFLSFKHRVWRIRKDLFIKPIQNCTVLCTYLNVGWHKCNNFQIIFYFIIHYLNKSSPKISQGKSYLLSAAPIINSYQAAALPDNI